MQIRPAQLAAHLSNGLAPLYVVHGDEPLLAIEAGDQIRTAARAAGFDEREVLVVESGFKWDAFIASRRNLGLFGSRKLIDLRMPSGKPGVDGARVARRLRCESRWRHDHTDHIAAPGSRRVDVDLVLGARGSGRQHRRVSARTQRVAAMDCHTTRAPAAASLPRHPATARRRHRRQSAGRTAGNREARPAPSRGRTRPRRSRAGRRRRRPFRCISACPRRGSQATPRGRAGFWLRSKPKARVCPCCFGNLAKTSMGWLRCLSAAATGTPIAVAVKTARVWGKRQSAMERAARRVAPSMIPGMLLHLAKLDALAKGIGTGNAWDRAARPRASAGRQAAGLRRVALGVVSGRARPAKPTANAESFLDHRTTPARMGRRDGHAWFSVDHHWRRPSSTSLSRR